MKRVVLVEDGYYSSTITALAKELRTDKYELVSSLHAANAYLCKRLSISSALRIERDRFAFSRVAGIFPVTEQLEVEVIPKFMTGNEAWRANFLLLLARTRWGILAERQMVATSKSRNRGISDSLGMVFLTMFDKVAHVPIRIYQRKILQQFEIEGDLDEETVLLPDKDGFVQTVTEFTRRNDYNAVICEAARILSLSVSDFGLRARLARALQELGPQGKLPVPYPRNIPSRFRGWADIYGLSIDILDGYGIDYISQGEIHSPGFVVRTSTAWEEFLRQALVNGMKDCSVAFQERYPFARRDASVVKVRPDYTIRCGDGRALLVDAKYKYGDAAKGAVSNSDIYEGWAFMEATGIPKLVLLYPYSSEGMSGPFEEFSSINNDQKEIIGVRVNPELVGQRGLTVFAKELAAFVEPMMHELEPGPRKTPTLHDAK